MKIPLSIQIMLNLNYVLAAVRKLWNFFSAQFLTQLKLKTAQPKVQIQTNASWMLHSEFALQDTALDLVLQWSLEYRNRAEQEQLKHDSFKTSYLWFIKVIIEYNQLKLKLLLLLPKMFSIILHSVIIKKNL